MGRLEGTVTIVTGAGRMRGIGRAICLHLAREGGAVAISAAPRDPATFPERERREAWLGSASVAAEIRSLGMAAIALDCDVSDPAQVDALVQRASDELGPLTGLVNNAGLASEAGRLAVVDMAPDIWARTIEVNLTGLYLMSRAAARAMLAHGRPSAIVNVSSLAGRHGVPNYGAYCASKFGVVGLTQQMAAELAPRGIRVNCICPGLTETDMIDGTFARTAGTHALDPEAVRAGMTAAVPMQRLGTPAEQAAVVAFLLSGDASYVTGQTLNVDGGMRMD